MNKSESYHVIEGLAFVVTYTEEGLVSTMTKIGEYQSGERFYYRTEDDVYHSLLIASECLVFHETTRGPFHREDTVYAPWAPAENDVPAVGKFLDRLRDRLTVEELRIGPEADLA